MASNTIPTERQGNGGKAISPALTELAECYAEDACQAQRHATQPGQASPFHQAAIEGGQGRPALRFLLVRFAGAFFLLKLEDAGVGQVGYLAEEQ